MKTLESNSGLPSATNSATAFAALKKRIKGHSRLTQQVKGFFWRCYFKLPTLRSFVRPESRWALGKQGEVAAERFLLKRGYTILFRNYEDRFGEVDLIAVDRETIVFVEVKTRSTDEAGDPTEAVDQAKQIHLTKTGVGFLKWHRLTEYSARFDVVAILGSPLGESAEIRHYVNAFEPTGEFQMFG